LNNLPIWKELTKQMSPLTFKIFLQVLYFFCRFNFRLQFLLTSLNVFCWAIPLARGLFLNNDFLLGLANSFSAGIFLMLAFTQMIPHALDIFQTHQLDLSYAFKYSVVGYLLILSVEKILFHPNFWKSSFPTEPISTAETSSKGSALEPTESEKNPPKNSTNSGLILVLAMSIHRFSPSHISIFFNFVEKPL
jgi:zinc transporter ZupT